MAHNDRDDREERLAQALRANLKRRKQQTRSRRPGPEGGAGSSRPDESETGGETGRGGDDAG